MFTKYVQKIMIKKYSFDLSTAKCGLITSCRFLKLNWLIIVTELNKVLFVHGKQVLEQIQQSKF